VNSFKTARRFPMIDDAVTSSSAHWNLGAQSTRERDFHSVTACTIEYTVSLSDRHAHSRSAELDEAAPVSRAD